MKKYYHLVLTEDQLTFLAENENRDLVNKVLETLVIRTSNSFDHIYDKNGFAIMFGTGQTLISDSELAELCGCDCKTVSKIVMELNDVGLISTLINEQKIFIHCGSLMRFTVLEIWVIPIRIVKRENY